jgi:hypothetical protein
LALRNQVATLKRQVKQLEQQLASRGDGSHERTWKEKDTTKYEKSRAEDTGWVSGPGEKWSHSGPLDPGSDFMKNLQNPQAMMKQLQKQVRNPKGMLKNIQKKLDMMDKEGASEDDRKNWMQGLGQNLGVPPDAEKEWMQGMQGLGQKLGFSFDLGQFGLEESNDD